MKPTVTTLDTPAVETLDVEIVERKGLGHPDSICDAITEQFSLALCRFYLDRFGLVLHHNVDKALLWGGSAKPAFGGGEVVQPFEFFVAGRATSEFRGVKVPVKALFHETATGWLRQHMHALDPAGDVVFHTLTRSGSPDLVDLFLRQRAEGQALANDTSVGVGYAPLSELETVVLRVEQHLNSPSVKAANPEIGEDIKIMGVRKAGVIHLTIGCAFVDRFLAGMNEYREAKDRVASIARQIAGDFTEREVVVIVNAADDMTSGSVFLTVTGTSAEAGDDGEAGRGNRANGLITPYRPMNMESIAGKNPITHVGKLYNIVAGLIAHALVEEIPDVIEAQCFLVSEIGKPIKEPQAVDIKLRLSDPSRLTEIRKRAQEIAAEQISRIDQIWSQSLTGEIGFDRWPLKMSHTQTPLNATCVSDRPHSNH
ncbi:methionine adenosyltransferase [Lutimaribacter saemankumensis]|uniref:S-adenosylmethionine synthetase n=1 Tax=Lutimaribacter saemankumensis TaxID=490829 RepID=A0A1G8T5M1_9RHOB|nr:methionine adenosyltransferase [Lutimaribacter saemankumensis]SDJ36773.1 S-adenosylmethionine synthetase [Lutimaribacter saemankumensis]